jgi:DNA-binding NarL/FixJ family response regulator
MEPREGSVPADILDTYQRLVRATCVPIPRAGEPDKPWQALPRLVEWGLAHDARQDDRFRYVVPTPPAIAQTHLALAHARSIASTVAQMKRTSDVLSQLTATTPAAVEDLAPVELIHGAEQVDAVARSMHLVARTEFLRVDAPALSPQVTERLSRRSFPDDVGVRGLLLRTVVDELFPTAADSAEMLRDAERTGEQIRAVRRCPVTMLIADQDQALMAVAETGAEWGLLVREKYLVAGLRALFDLLWARGRPLTAEPSADSFLTATEQRILVLLGYGRGDAAIGRALDLSERSVRRHVANLLAKLGAESRFAAGAEAARRGLI